MKYLTSLIIVSIVLILIAYSCKKAGSNTLPLITQTGANTFGCLINGNVFTPGGALAGGNLNAIYQYEYTAPGAINPSGFEFVLNGTDERNSCNVTSIEFEFDSVLMFADTYQLLAPKAGSGYGIYSNFNCNGTHFDLNTSDSVTGQLIMTRFDLTNQIASGTFWFNVLGNDGNITHITDGRFDVHFIY